MKRKITLFFCSLLIITGITGCGKQETSVPEIPEVEVTATPITEVTEETPETKEITMPPLYDISRFKDVRTLFDLSFYEPTWTSRVNDANTAIWYYPHEDSNGGFITVTAETMKDPVNFVFGNAIGNIVNGGELVHSEKATVNKKDAYTARYFSNTDTVFDVYTYIVPCEHYLYCIAFSKPGELKDYEVKFLDNFVAKVAITDISSFEAAEKIKAAEEKEKERLKNLYLANDFLSNGERRNTYDELQKAGKYDEIYAMVNDYIDNNTPDQKDTAYKIKGYLDPLMEQWEKIAVEDDKVEGTRTFYYKDLTKVSKSAHIIPYMTNDDDDINVWLGFRASDWIFFDEITITTSGDNISFSVDYSDRKEDIVSGGTVEERTLIGWFNEKILKDIANCPDAIIRFEGDNEKKYDYDVSQTEKDALLLFADFYYVRKDIANILEAYQSGLDYDSFTHTIRK